MTTAYCLHTNMMSFNKIINPDNIPGIGLTQLRCTCHTVHPMYMSPSMRTVKGGWQVHFEDSPADTKLLKLGLETAGRWLDQLHAQHGLTRSSYVLKQLVAGISSWT